MCCIACDWRGDTTISVFFTSIAIPVLSASVAILIYLIVGEEAGDFFVGEDLCIVCLVRTTRTEDKL